jgi:hypothetical protein
MDPQIEVRAPFNADALYKGVGYPPPYTRTGLETLDGISAADYNRYFKGNIKGATDSIRFDRLRVGSGAALAKGEIALFTIPNGGQGVMGDGTTNYKKGLDDTNMTAGGQMEYENFFIVESLQVELIVTAQAATADTNNEVTDPTAAAIISSPISASINARTALTQAWLSFQVGDRRILEGRLIDFPSQGGMSGFGGDLSEGFIQNGVGFAKALREIVVLRPQENFAVKITFPTTFTPTQDLDIVVKLAGVRLKPVG